MFRPHFPKDADATPSGDIPNLNLAKAVTPWPIYPRLKPDSTPASPSGKFACPRRQQLDEVPLGWVLYRQIGAEVGHVDQVNVM